MGRALARRLAERGDAVFLLGRDAGDLAASARDIEVRAARAAGIDRDRPVRSRAPRRLRRRARRRRRGAERVRHRRRDGRAVRDAGQAGGGRRLRAPAADRRLRQHGPVLRGGPPPACSRAAAARCACSARSRASAGRKPVIIYGAAKAGLSAYLEGLDHKFHDKGLRMICVKPGFVRTGMTAAPEAAAVRGRAGRGRARRRARDRPRAPGGLRAGNLAPDHDGHPDAAAIRDAQDRLLSPRAPVHLSINPDRFLSGLPAITRGRGQENRCALYDRPVDNFRVRFWAGKGRARAARSA